MLCSVWPRMRASQTRRPSPTTLVALAFGLAALVPPVACSGGTVPDNDVPPLAFETYRLDNGLRVILHEDHATPTVAVNVWYHVGSKNEVPGRTGFAHLFEHMMFQGSVHHDDDYFKPLYAVGAEVNGSTSEDRTNYWENVPADQLALALWLEADRMGYLLPAMTAERLANQKDVVQNEKRQYDNQPYARFDEMLARLLFPAGHPYGHTVLGSLEDIGAATAEDVSEFFRLYYAPNNASLAIAGDFDPAAARRLVEQYFGSIPPGHPVERMEAWVPVLDGVRRVRIEDQIELPRLYMVWPTPGWYEPGDAEADLLVHILAGGKQSRLYRSLVYEQQIAQDVDASQDSRELCGVFYLQATARAGHTLGELEAAIDTELRQLLAEGVSRDELALAQTGLETDTIRSLQFIGGFGGKADRLNRYAVLAGDPDYLDEDLARYRDATPELVTEHARQLLDLDRRVIMHFEPHGTLTAADETVDRTVQPAGAGPVRFEPPAIQTAALDNGLRIFVVEKHELPLVQVTLVLGSGWAADPVDRPGTAALTAAMLDEGAGGRSALDIATEARRLGARFGSGSFFDGTFVNLNVLRRHLDTGLELLHDVALEPDFPPDELERQRALQLGRIQQERSQPWAVARRVFQRRIFGEGHPYAQPMTGSGTTASVEALARQDLVAFHASHFLPNNASVIVVGDITLDEARHRLASTFGGWRRGELPSRPVPPPGPTDSARILIVDRPGAAQSYVLAGQVGMPENDPDRLAFDLMNTTLGSHFGARINMNLREDKGYTYGAYSFPVSMREGGMFLCTAPVQVEFTRETVVELQRELEEIGGTRPVSAEELDSSRSRLLQGFPQQFETLGDIANQLVDLVLYDLPLDDWQTYAGRLEGYDLETVRAMARRHVHPDQLVYIIVGDRATIEPELRELGLGDVEVVDALSI
ncbi:MAG: pitrilysin family protein [Candidatus Eiseniibacteriota bacterium]